MVLAYLSLGSNMGDRHAFLAKAYACINDLTDVRITQTSSIYDTPPWGYTEQATFYNCVFEIETRLSAPDLLANVLEIELVLGRERLFKYGPRVIDIDILLYGEATYASPTLTVPHPYMYERAFVLVPLKEIAPQLVTQDYPALQEADTIVKVGEPLQ